MYPIYRYMDSYPQTCHPHRDQAPYPPHVYPSCESPFNGTSRYFTPGDCNGYWTHVYPPMPFIPYPHPQSPQHHFHGAYPPCPNMYPAYFIPPPQYFVDQGRSHCCGCPNHSCHKKDDIGLKIEEEKPEIELKDNGSSGMTRWPAYPYPPVWFPPRNMKDDDHKTSKLKDNDSPSAIQWPTYPYPQFWFSPDHMKDINHKASESQQHGPLARWIPLDMNSLKENGEKKIQNQENGAKRMQLPLPIIWMPSCDESQGAEKNVKDANESPRVSENLPPKFKIIPVNLLENDNRNDKPAIEDVSTGTQVCPTLPDKGSRSKNIPVKHMEESGLKKVEHPDKEGDYDAEQLNAPEKKKEENLEKTTSDIGTKRQKSPGRSSKLPPVCLRVDPLPRKKTGNGSPRSPSLHENKVIKSDQESKQNRTGGADGLKEFKKEATMDKDVRVVGAEDRSNGKSHKDNTKDVNMVAEIEDMSTSKKEGEGRNLNKLDVGYIENHSGLGIEAVADEGKNEDIAEGVENEKHRKLEDSEEVSFGHSEKTVDDHKNTIEESDVKKMEENRWRGGKLSETDAALLIQAVFRGYEVRRWEPLKKLKEIARIHERVSSIKQQIHSLEVSSEGGKLDEKQKLFIGETIMNLLLQLDTIQGLHLRVREIRKSVARELVSLQEKLDALSGKAASGPVHVEAGDGPTFEDSNNAIEGAVCTSSSGLKESHFPLEEPAESSIDILDHSTGAKHGGAGSQQDRIMESGDIDQSSTPDNEHILIEIRNKQVPNSEVEPTVRSEFENAEPSCSETEEHTRHSTAPEIGADSMTSNVSEPATREEHAYTGIEKARELLQGLQDERVQASGEDDSPVEVDTSFQEDNKAEAKAEELHEMLAKEVKQPAANTQPFSAADSIMFQGEHNLLQEEDVVPVVEELMNAKEREPMPSTEGSEALWQSEDSGKASIMQTTEIGQGELPDKPLENYYAEVDDASSRVLPCWKSTIPERDVKENGSESVTVGKDDYEELSGCEYVDPEVPVKEGDAECPKVGILGAPAPAYVEVAVKEGDTEHPKMEMEILDAPVPASSTGAADLADDDNNHKMPTLVFEENSSKEEENESNLELLGIKDIDTVPVGSTIETESCVEPTSSMRASVGFKVPEIEKTPVDDMEHERKLIEENEKLREMMKKLLEAGNKQLAMISSLTGRVKDLEKKVSRRRKLRMKHHRESERFP